MKLAQDARERERFLKAENQIGDSSPANAPTLNAMKLIEFPEQTVVIAKDQPQYLPLPAHRFANNEQGRIACCWKLTWRERLEVLLTGKLWHEILTFNQPLQPQKLSVVKPEMKVA